MQRIHSILYLQQVWDRPPCPAQNNDHPSLFGGPDDSDTYSNYQDDTPSSLSEENDECGQKDKNDGDDKSINSGASVHFVFPNPPSIPSLPSIHNTPNIPRTCGSDIHNTPSIHSQSSLPHLQSEPSAPSSTPSMVTSSTAPPSLGEAPEETIEPPPLPPKDYQALLPALANDSAAGKSDAGDDAHSTGLPIKSHYFFYQDEPPTRDDASAQSLPPIATVPSNSTSLQKTLRREASRLSIKRKHLSKKLKRALSFQKTKKAA